MKTITMLSSERNMLIRILENYEQYINSDKKKTDNYKLLELQKINTIRQRAMGHSPKQDYEQRKYVDNSMFGFLMED